MCEIGLNRRRTAIGLWRYRWPSPTCTPMRADNLSKYLMAERCDGCLARWQAMLRQEFCNRAIRCPFLPKFNDDFLRREQILEFLWPARRKFRDRLSDCCWIKCGHGLQVTRIDTEKLVGGAMSATMRERGRIFARCGLQTMPVLGETEGAMGSGSRIARAQIAIMAAACP